MKRIISLDFLRGLAMIFMLAFHVLIHVSWHAQASNYSNLQAIIDSGLLWLFVIIFILANFRALFLMVSMTIHAYILTKTMNKENAKSILTKNLFFALMLYFVALFTEGIAANWGVLGRSIQLGRWAPEYIHRVMHFETLNSIAVSIAIITLVFYALVKSGIIGDKKKTLSILTALAVCIVVLSAIILPFVEVWFPGYYGDALYSGQYTFNSVGEFFQKLLMSALFGVEQPILPFMCTTFIGGIIGYQLAQPDVKKDMPKKGMFIGLLVIVAGVIVLLTDLRQFKVEFDVFPVWFYLFTTGLQIIILMAVLRMVEFSERVAKSDKLQKFATKTVWVRRWGLISLTLFVWQVYPEFLMRWLGNVVTGGQVEFFIRGQAGGLPSIIMIIVVLIVWDLLIRLWEKAKFKYSFEWIMATIAAKVLGNKIRGIKDPTERLNIQETLYNPEPIIFLK